MGHWYDWDGGARHTVIIKSGKNKGQERDTHVGDARKNNWVPSFSGVWDILAAQALEKWKRNQLLLAAADCRRDPFDGDQAWMNAVLALYTERTTKARDLGTAIHRAIEGHLTGDYSYDQKYLPAVLGALEALNCWCGVDDVIIEKSFAHELGYGGQCDVHKRGFVADFKSKEFTEDDLPDVWNNHKAQLAAYREGLGMPDARCAIIYVSTSVPGLTHIVEIPEKDLEHGWNLFVQCLRLWQIEKQYWPAKEEELV